MRSKTAKAGDEKAIAQVIITEKMAKDEFERKIGRLSRSPAYLDFCEEAYGYRMYLFNMMDREQLDFLFDKVPFNKNQTMIDAGCGMGSIIDTLAIKYECNGIGIDLLSKDIVEKNLRKAAYIEGDIENLTEYPLKPDVILAVDSLYFSSDLAELIKKMTAYADCRYYFYYSQYIFDDANEDQSVLETDNTRIAKALQRNGVPYSAINYSENERIFYGKCIEILPKYELRFQKEENHDLYLSMMNEYRLGRELYEKHRASRYLYMGVL